jgi:purine-binding chemotaxis protein CheW
MGIPETRQSDREQCIVLIDVGDQQFCIAVESVQEIVLMATLARPPAMPSILEGFLNLRGTAIPVLRLDTLFGVPGQALEPYTPLVVLRHSDTQVALKVQRVIGIQSVPSSSFLPLQDNDCFKGCIRADLLLDARVVHVIAVDRLLLERERRVIAEFQTVESRRLHDLKGPQA